MSNLQSKFRNNYFGITGIIKRVVMRNLLIFINEIMSQVIAVTHHIAISITFLCVFRFAHINKQCYVSVKYVQLTSCFYFSLRNKSPLKFYILNV